MEKPEERDPERAAELIAGIAKTIGDDAAAKLSSDMIAVRDEAWEIYEKEKISEDSIRELSDLFVRQFHLGVESVNLYLKAKGSL